ncbi:MAG: hypothetical protein WCY93_11095 [Anaerolineaceae bacterium]
MSALDKLKKKKNNSLDKLREHIDRTTKKGFSNADDDKYWKPTRDSNGNSSAIIRFLPVESVDEDIPFVEMWDHGFQGPGGWYIEKSLTTIQKPDPVSEYNSKLWNSGVEANKEIARKQKRRMKYISNIYVVKDPNNPASEGRVFLYAYGKKIFQKINDMIYPEFDDDKPVDPFDIFEGANFRLKIRQVDGFPNYDRSEWDTPGPLSDDEDELEKIVEQIHPLQPLHDPSSFKTYEELEAKLYRVLGLGDGNEEAASRRETATKRAETLVDEDIDMTKVGASKEVEEPKQKETKVSESVAEEDTDSDLDFFRKLAAS